MPAFQREQCRLIVYANDKVVDVFGIVMCIKCLGGLKHIFAC